MTQKKNRISPLQSLANSSKDLEKFITGKAVVEPVEERQTEQKESEPVNEVIQAKQEPETVQKPAVTEAKKENKEILSEKGEGGELSSWENILKPIDENRKKEKFDNTAINQRQKDIIKMLSALEDVNINVIMFNVLEEFIKTYKLDQLYDEIQRKKNKRLN